MVKLALLDGLKGWTLKVSIIGVESDGMSKEINGVSFQLEILVDILHWDLWNVQFLPSVWISLIEAINKDDIVTSSLLLKETHQTRFDDFGLSGGYFVDLVSS